MQVWISGALIVLGLFAIVPYPLAGMPMIGLGYFLFEKTTPAQRHDAGSLFFGICLLCMVVVGAVSLVRLG